VPNLLKQILTEMIANVDHPAAPKLLRDGDLAHVKRWLADGRGADIAAKIYSSHCAHNYNAMFHFIMTVVSLRRTAEEMDQLNRDLPLLDKQAGELAPAERKRNSKMLRNNEMSVREFVALDAMIEETEAGCVDNVLSPILSVRADKNGSRKRTLFCRLLSNIVSKGSRKHYAEIAVLCEIAFNRKDITSDVVRSACEAGRRDKRRK
jgi:hypothetical protein